MQRTACNVQCFIERRSNSLSPRIIRVVVVTRETKGRHTLSIRPGTVADMACERVVILFEPKIRKSKLGGLVFAAVVVVCVVVVQQLVQRAG